MSDDHSSSQFLNFPHNPFYWLVLVILNKFVILFWLFRFQKLAHNSETELRGDANSRLNFL